MRAGGSEILHSKLICIYGYSLTSLIPSVFLGFLPIPYIEVIVLIISVLLSFSIIFKTIWDDVKNFEKSKKYISLGLVIVFQVLLFLLLKFYFLKDLYRIV